MIESKVPVFTTFLEKVFKEVQKELKWSYNNAAYVTGIDASYFSLISKGRVPSQKMLARLATAYEQNGISKEKCQLVYWSSRTVPPDIPLKLLKKYALLSSLPVKEQERVLAHLEVPEEPNGSAN